MNAGQFDLDAFRAEPRSAEPRGGKAAAKVRARGKSGAEEIGPERLAGLRFMAPLPLAWVAGEAALSAGALRAYLAIVAAWMALRAERLPMSRALMRAAGRGSRSRWAADLAELERRGLAELERANGRLPVATWVATKGVPRAAAASPDDVPRSSRA